VNLVGSRDRGRCRDGGKHALGAIIVEADVAVLAAGILPGDREHGEALLGQELHQRVLRREVEDVVLHDPGRHDHDRFGVNARRCRRVLDDLGERCAMHDLARRCRQGLADPEGVRASRGLAATQPKQIVEPVRRTADEVHAAFRARPLQNQRIGGEEIRRRDRAQQLADGERGHVFVAPAYPAHPGGGALPPAFDREERMRVGVEWECPPFIRAKAVVLRQRAAAWIDARARRARHGIGHVPQAAERGLRAELQDLAGRERQMHGPIGKRAGERRGRDPSGESRNPGMQRAIERAAGRFNGGLGRLPGWLGGLGRLGLLDNDGIGIEHCTH
jgi:hypothetical protein